MAAQYGKPFFCRKLKQVSFLREAEEWIEVNGVLTLNVGGPRESSHPGIYEEAFSLLRELFTRLAIDRSKSRSALPTQPPFHSS
jgi:hypothetical protein